MPSWWVPSSPSAGSWAASCFQEQDRVARPGRHAAAAGLTARLQKSFPEQHALHEKACVHGIMATLIGNVSSSSRRRLSLRAIAPRVRRHGLHGLNSRLLRLSWGYHADTRHNTLHCRAGHPPRLKRLSRGKTPVLRPGAFTKQQARTGRRSATVSCSRLPATCAQASGPPG